MSSRCNIVKNSVPNSNYIKIPTAFYVECNGVTIHICVIYRRGSFLWIPGDNYATRFKKVFGDITRAVNR